MLVTVHHCRALVLTVAAFAGKVQAKQFAELGELIVGLGHEHRGDLVMMFAHDITLDDDAAEGFLRFAQLIAARDPGPISISCALIGADAAAKTMLQGLAKQAPPSKHSRIVAAAFDDVHEAAFWIGLDESGVSMMKSMQGFEAVTREPRALSK